MSQTNNVPLIGGSCVYTNVPGIAKIVTLTNAPSDANNCPHDPVEVIFDFYPDNTNAPSQYRFPKTPDTRRHLTVGAGMNPSRKYIVTEKGLQIGKPYRCNRKEIISGACPPVLFEFTTVDLSDYAQSCFGQK